MLALDITGLKKVYKDGTEALTDINLKVEEGDFFALLGANGAGKSTAIGILTDLVTKTAGSIKVFGMDIDTNFIEVKKTIGVVPQEISLDFFSTVLQIVVTSAGYQGVPKEIATKRAEVILKRLNLWEKRNTQAIQLSGGMKRRVMIARALIHEPKMLILDEPTAGVDVQLRRDMLEYLQELNEAGTTIILTTHYLEEAEELCENVAIINKGKVVVDGAIKDVINSMESETFIFEIEEFSKKISIEGVNKIDDVTLEVEVTKDQTLNTVVTNLDSKKINIKAIKPKGNRLEELFVQTINS